MMWFSIGLLFVLCRPIYAIWPEPVTYTNGSSTLWIQQSIHVTYNGANLSTSSYTPPTPETISSLSVVSSAVSRAFNTTFYQNIVPWKLYPRNELSQFEPAANASKTYINLLQITQTGVDNSSTFKPLPGQVDESYSLTISTNGSAQIVAVSSTGVLRALESFTQLFYEHSAGAGIYTTLAPVYITDAPVYEHRGLLMDVSRNYYPVESILRTIEAISMSKFNIFHIHMTDSQSWPMDIPALPELSQKGAYRTGLSYSPSDIQEIQIYAINRGVNVIIEFDSPGHTTSIGLSYPELITAFNAMPWSTYCSEPPCGALKLNSTAVDDFMNTLYGDVLPRVSPYTAYFHSGGDEINVQDYLLDDGVNSNLTSVITPLLQAFVDRNLDQVRANGLTPMVWEELFTTWNLTLGPDVVIQTWGVYNDSVRLVTGAGHKAVVGGDNFWYLDCGFGQWIDFSNGASYEEYYPFNDYCSPQKNWELIYSYDPVGALTAEEATYVLGGEIAIWSELTDPMNLDSKVWPRASAAGEVLWSGRHDASGQNRSQITAAPRLAELTERMVRKGIRSGPVQMIFCTQSNSTECSL